MAIEDGWYVATKGRLKQGGKLCLLILPMKREIAPTDSIKLSNSYDLSSPNDLLHLQCSGLPSGLTLAGVGWLTVNLASSSHDDAFRVLKLVYASIVRALEGKTVWLIAGLSAWQPDTRIVRYRKFWGAMKARGVDTQDLLSPAEQMLEQDGELRFY